jgi:hypothetical protein
MESAEGCVLVGVAKPQGWLWPCEVWRLRARTELVWVPRPGLLFRNCYSWRRAGKV